MSYHKNKKLNLPQNLLHTVIPVFSRLMTRARSLTVYTRKTPESRFEDARCVYALWIPFFFGRGGDACVRRMCSYIVNTLPQSMMTTPPEKTGMTAVGFSLLVTV